MKPFLSTLRTCSPSHHAKACCIHSNLHGPGCTPYTTAASSARNQMNESMKSAILQINIVCMTITKQSLSPITHPIYTIFSKSSITFNTGNQIFGKLSANYAFITELSFGKSEESVTQTHFSSANQSKCRRRINMFSKYTCYSHPCHIGQKLHSFRYWTLTSMQVHLKHSCVASLVSRFETDNSYYQAAGLVGFNVYNVIVSRQQVHVWTNYGR